MLRCLRVALFLLVPMLVLAWASPLLAQERRVALVIGADQYRHIPRLTNAVADARAVAARLQALGFEVIGPVLNPTRAELVDARDQLEQKVKGADLGLLFYAGHAVEVEERNILLPIDAPAAQTRRQIEAGGVFLHDILNEMQQLVPRVIAILDACRDNPLPRDAVRGNAPVVGSRGGLTTRGLEPIDGLAGGGGRFVVFAAQPGSTALDRLPNDPPTASGLFTRHLLRELDQPDRPILALMSEVRDRVAEAARSAGRSQRPHIDDRLEGSNRLILARAVRPPATPQAAQPAVLPVPPPPTVGTDALDLAFWQSIQASTNPADFLAYRNAFPQGRFLQLALNRLNALRPPAAAQPATPAVRALTPEEVSAAQRLLTALGFNTGGSDGVAGPRSQAAIASFAQVSLRPDETQFDTANLERLQQMERAFQRATDRGPTSPRGRAAASVAGAVARFEQGFAAERASPPDPEEAAYWYGLAAREHEPRALNQLGLLMIRGQGVAQDAAGASLLWRLAAARGDATAAFNLGAMLERGIGLPRNPGWAKYFYDMAAHAGHPQAREASRRVAP
jgi:uncharacterized caspase-like protein